MDPVIASHFLTEKSLLTSEMMVAWKRTKGAYNFKTLPDKAIIGIEANIFSNQIHFFTKKIKGIRGQHYIHNSFILCSGFGSGAPAIITLMEELRALGVKEFIFIGLAGSLIKTIHSGDPFYVEQALSGCGVASYYHKDNTIVPYEQEFIKDLSTNLQLKGVTCFSTDSPFRETPSLMENIKAKGCQLIEMECAAIYAFAQFYKLKAACFLIAADSLHDNWKYPSKEVDLVAVQKNLVTGIIKSLS